MTTPRWRLGTTGFTDPDWVGGFYPRDVKSGEHLPYYARFFDAVEIDTTFHAAPTPERVRRWADSVPDDFAFCVKTPKAITHGDTLVGTLDSMLSFLDAIRAFGPKLGAVLIQFPPSLTESAFAPLEKLLAGLPPDLRFAVEFRHDSWNTPRTEQLLRAHRCAWVAADFMIEPWGVRATTDFLYVRWIGQHDRFPTHREEQVDVTERLRWWAEEIRAAAPAPAATVYGFFNNDYAGYSVGTLNRFRGVVGLPVRQPTPRDRGELFG